jgi:hypothetical protein
MSTKTISELTRAVCLVLCILTFLSFVCVNFFSSTCLLAQNIPYLEDICNLIDRTNTDTKGNDCNTDELNELHHVLQQLFHFFYHMLLQVQRLSPYILIATLYQQLTQEATNNEAFLCTPEQGRTDGMDDADDVARDDSNDDVEFPNDDDSFVIMIPVVTMSQKIVVESAASKVFYAVNA